MRYFQSYHGHAYTFARHSFFKPGSHSFGKKVHGLKIIVVDVKDVAVFFFGHNESVSGSYGVDVKKSEKLVVFSNFVAGYFPGNDT